MNPTEVSASLKEWEREKRKKNLTAASNGIWCDSKSSENRRSHSNNNTDMMLSIWRDLSLSLYVYVRKHISGWCLFLCAHRMKKNDDWRLFWPTPSAQHKPLDGIQSLARFGYTSLIQLERSHIRIRDMRKWRQTEQIHRKKKNNNNSSTQPKRKKELDLCERCSVHISVGITCFASQRHRQKRTYSLGSQQQCDLSSKKRSRFYFFSLLLFLFAVKEFLYAKTFDCRSLPSVNGNIHQLKYLLWCFSLDISCLCQRERGS